MKYSFKVLCEVLPKITQTPFGVLFSLGMEQKDLASIAILYGVGHGKETLDDCIELVDNSITEGKTFVEVIDEINQCFVDSGFDKGK